MTLFDRLGISGRRRLITAALSLGAWLLLAAGASQAGTIKTVLVTPSSPKVKQVVTISVKGVGVCKKMKLSYGDGSPNKAFSEVDFANGKTLVETHHYDDPGPKTVKLWGTKKCSGSFKATVNVQPNLTVQRGGQRPMGRKLGKVSVEKTPKPLMQLKPKIQDISSIPGPRARPGADLHITGIAFGDQEGSVYIHGNFNNSPRKVSTIKSWSDTEVIAQVPVNWGGAFGGVCGWTIQVEVRSAKNVASYKAGMIWAEQHRNLSWKDSAVSATKCGYDGNIDMCNGKRELQGCFITTFSHDGKANPKLTIDGLHFNCAAAPEDDKGTDKYAIALPPGWVFETLLVKNKKTSDKGDKDNWITGPSPAFPVGKTNWNPSFGWNVTPDDWIRYEYLVKAKAPETCPWPN